MLALWRSNSEDSSPSAMIEALRKIPTTMDIIQDIELNCTLKDTAPPPDPPTTQRESLTANILLKTLLILGKTGSGKSTLCNRLAGEEHDSDTFPVSSGARLCTQENLFKKVNFGGDETKEVTIIDTVGFDDPDKDETALHDLLRTLKETCRSSISTFGITINGQCKRLDDSCVKMLQSFQNSFGEAFWKNCVFIFTHLSMDKAHLEKRRKMSKKSDQEMAQEYMKEVNSRFPGSLNASSLILDSCYDEENPEENSLFENNFETLYEIMKNTEDFLLPPLPSLPTHQRNLSVRNIRELPAVIKEEPCEPVVGAEEDEEEVPLQRTSKKRTATKHEESTMVKMKRQNSEPDEEEFLRSRQEARKHHEAILAYSYPKRLTLSAWVEEIQEGSIHPPNPLTYHRRYLTNQAFLKDSFKGEALPGVFFFFD